MAEKYYLDIVDGVEIYRKGKKAAKANIFYETDGAIDTLFDTEYDEANAKITFGAGCASWDDETGTLTVEGQLVGDTIYIS